MCWMKRSVWMLAATLLLSCGSVQAEDWPQWLGSERNSVWTETGLIQKFPEEGPPVLWRKEIGLGYAGPAVAGSKVYLFDYQLDSGDLAPSASARNRLIGEERILCLDAETGKQIWEYKYDCSYFVSYPSGPRCTPTVHDGLVYALGAEGNLTCLNAENGKKQWSRALKQEFGMEEAPFWGFSGHPLVDGDLLYCIVGGEGSTAVAFNRKTGEVVWKNLTAEEPGYAPPTMINVAGTKQLIIWHAESINSLHPLDGSVYWSHPLKPQYGMSIATPRLEGDLLYAAGMGDTGAAYRITAGADGKPQAEPVWTGTGRTGVYPANSTPFIEDGVIYGCNVRPGTFVAADLNTGERLWETTELITGDRPAPHATAFIVKNGNRFVLFTETGDLVFVNLSRAGFREISRAHVIEPTGDAFGRPVVWTHPAFAHRRCYIRNDKEVICVDLSAQK